MRCAYFCSALLVSTGWSQAPPPSPQARSASELPEYLKGEEDMFLTPHMKETMQPLDLPAAARERPSGQSVSVARLQHKVPKQASKAFRQAAIFSSAGKDQEAAARLETAVQVDPKFAAAYTQLGKEYVRLGRLYDALVALNRAVEFDPNSWDSHYVLAVLFFQAGDLTLAEESARRALALAEANPATHLMLGYVLTFRPETKAAGIAHIEYAARSLPYAQQVLREVKR